MEKQLELSLPRFDDKKTKLSYNLYKTEKKNNISGLLLISNYLNGDMSKLAASGKVNSAIVDIPGIAGSANAYREAIKFWLNNTIVDNNNKTCKYLLNGKPCFTLEAIVNFVTIWSGDTSSERTQMRNLFIKENYINKYDGNGSIPEVDIVKMTKFFKDCNKPGYFKKDLYESTDLFMAEQIARYKSGIIDEDYQQSNEI